MINNRVTTRRPASYWWGMCAVWFSGLIAVGYGALPTPDVTAFLFQEEVAEENMPHVVTEPTQCWQPLAKYAAVTSLTGSADNVRGSLVSLGQRFLLRQDASGHLYRQPVSDSRKIYNDKRTGFGTAAVTVHDTGNPNEAMPLHDVVDRLSNIQRCDGRHASHGGGEGGL